MAHGLVAFLNFIEKYDHEDLDSLTNNQIISEPNKDKRKGGGGTIVAPIAPVKLSKNYVLIERKCTFPLNIMRQIDHQVEVETRPFYGVVYCLDSSGIINQRSLAGPLALWHQGKISQII